MLALIALVVPLAAGTAAAAGWGNGAHFGRNEDPDFTTLPCLVTEEVFATAAMPRGG